MITNTDNIPALTLPPIAAAHDLLSGFETKLNIHTIDLIKALLLLLLCCVPSGKNTDTNLIVFGLNRSAIEPTIYHTRDEHAIHYTTLLFRMIL
jgi:hypothetical protein